MQYSAYPPGPAVDLEIEIDAPAAQVWQSLTVPQYMKQWMPDAVTTIESSWQSGQPIFFRGDLHGILFENKGTIMRFQPEQLLEYSFWSSLSGQADLPENYSLISFRLTPSASGTILHFSQTNFIAETTYRHSLFYWKTVLGIMKKMHEQENAL